jgi:copper chaperone
MGYVTWGAMTTIETFKVAGMNCGHCVDVVTAEVSKLAGVSEVAVDLDNGSVTVESESPLDGAAVAAAIDEAGYEVVS